MSVANSPLVKTAIAGEDAIGARGDGGRQGRRARQPGQAVDSFNGIRVAKARARSVYNEAEVSEVMRTEDPDQDLAWLRQGRDRVLTATSPRNMSRSTATTGVNFTPSKATAHG